MYHYRESGLGNVYLKNGFVLEDHPDYGQLVSISNAEGLHKTIGNAIAGKTAPLTGDEFRYLRVELNLSQKALGDLFDVSDQTVARWEKEETEIPRTAELVIRNYFLQSKFGDTKIKELTDKLASLDAEKIMLDIYLEETQETWFAVDKVA
jgi:DNA-binding transcriptional regulator YiaG